MSELADYRVETDTTILLVYKDGTELRVPTRRLARYLQGDELVRVREALRLRSDFIRKHLPKDGLAIGLAAGMLAIGLVGGNHLAHLGLRPTAPTTAPAVAVAATPIATPLTVDTTVATTSSGEVAGAATVAAVPTSAAVTTATPAAATAVTPTKTPRPSVSKVVTSVTKPTPPRK